MFLGTGLAGLEAWPLTGWKLYAARSTETRAEWRLAAVHADGTEEVVDFYRLPLRYREGSFGLKRVGHAGPGERQSICRAWQNVLQERGVDAAGVRIYTSVRRTPTARGARPELVSQQVRAEC